MLVTASLETRGSPLKNTGVFTSNRRSKSNPIITDTLLDDEPLIKCDLEIASYSQKKVNGLKKVSIVSCGCLAAYYKNTGHIAVYSVEDGSKKMKEVSLCWLSKEPEIVQSAFPYFVMTYKEENIGTIIKIFKFSGLSKEVKIDDDVLYMFTLKNSVIVITDSKIITIYNYRVPTIEDTIEIEKPLKITIPLSNFSFVRDNVALIVTHSKKDFLLLDLFSGKWLSDLMSFNNHILTIDFNSKYVVLICFGDIYYYIIATKQLKMLETGDSKPSSIIFLKENVVLIGFTDGAIVKFDLEKVSKVTLVKRKLSKDGILNLKECILKMYALDDYRIIAFKQYCATLYSLGEHYAIIKSTLEWQGKGTHFALFKPEDKFEPYFSKSDNSSHETMTSESEKKDEPEIEINLIKRSRSVDRSEIESRHCPSPISFKDDSISINFKVTNTDGTEHLWIWRPLLKLKDRLTPTTRKKVSRTTTLKLDKLAVPLPIFKGNEVGKTLKNRGVEHQEKYIKENSKSKEAYDFTLHDRGYNKNIDCLHIRRLRVNPLSLCVSSPLPLLNADEFRVKDLFKNDLLYYYLELYLKENHSEEILYLVVDIEDFRSCYYENHSVLENCAKSLISLWIEEDEYSLTENYAHLKNQKPTTNMFDDLLMEALESLKSRWGDFVRWYTLKTEIAPKRTSTKRSRVEKILVMHSIENKFELVLTDDLLYKYFSQYLKDINASQWLNFYEAHTNFSKHVNYLPSDQILQEVEKMVSLFFVNGNWKSHLYIEDNSLLQSMMKLLLNKDLYVLNIFDHLALNITQNVESLYWNFCYFTKLKNPRAQALLAYFSNKDRNTLLEDFLKMPGINTQLTIHDTLYGLRNETEKPNMINHFRDIKETARLIHNNLTTFKFLKNTDTERFKKMYELKVFSVGMFNGIFEKIEQNLIMIYVDI